MEFIYHKKKHIYSKELEDLMNKVQDLTKKLDSLLHFCHLNNPHRTRDDIVALFSIVDTLIPEKIEWNGIPYLALRGTIPIIYKNSKYSIPVLLRIPPAYPSIQPSLRVLAHPQSNIILTPNHRRLDENGNYNLVLENWDSNSKLVDFIEIIQVEFGEDPPVRSKPPNQNYQNPFMQPKQPVYPQYNNPQYPPNNPQYQNNNPQQQPYINTQYKPYSPQNPQSSQNPTVYPQNNMNPGYKHVYPNSNYQQGGQVNYKPQYQNGQYQPPQQNYNYSPSQTVNPLNGSSHNPMNSINQKQDPVSTQSRPQNQNYELDPHIEAISNLSSKMDQLLKSHYLLKNSEYTHLQRENLILEKENRAIESKIKEIEDNKDRQEAEIKKLNASLEELKKWISENDETEEIDIDLVATPKNKRRAHVLRLLAEDISYEEILHYLDEALRKRVIDVSTYIKVYKEISAEQYLCRALIEKVDGKYHNDHI